MISDFLFEMVEGLDRYLNNPFYDDMYSGTLRESIIRMRDDAEYIRFVLDTPNPASDAPESFIREQIAARRRERRPETEHSDGHFDGCPERHRYDTLGETNMNDEPRHEPNFENVVSLVGQISAILGQEATAYDVSECDFVIGERARRDLTIATWSVADEDDEEDDVRLCRYDGKLLVFIEDHPGTADAVCPELLTIIGHCAYHDVPWIVDMWCGIENLGETIADRRVPALQQI
jgi:hypothetical protein